MAARRNRNLSFLPEQQPVESAVDANGLPLDIGVGELLRMYRERNGQELQSVANQLRVRLVYLAAIEEGRFKDLPGTTYAVGFLRSYADFLGLDSADVVRRFREEVARAHGQPRLIFPNIAAEGKIPGSALLLLSVLGAAIVYAAWYYISSRQSVDLSLIAEVPDRLVALPPGEGSENPSAPPSKPVASESTASARQAEAVAPPAASGSDTPDTPSLAPQDALESDEDPTADGADGGSAATGTTVPPQDLATGQGGQDNATATASEAAATQPSSSETTPATADSPPPADQSPTAAVSVTSPDFIPPAPPVPPAPSLPPVATTVATAPAELGPRILIEARIDSWIEVLDAEGKAITAQVLRAGESFAPPDQPGMTLTTGNAGGLDIIVDGAKAPALGEVGAVKRKIPLEPEKLKAGQTVSE
ncbi:MAG: RodZ domain-containing protein [Dongiaceae bacterium]